MNRRMRKQLVNSTILQTKPVDNSIIVLRVEEGESQSLADNLARALHHMGVRNTLVVVLSKDASIEQLDENEMRKYGWVRAPVAEGAK